MAPSPGSAGPTQTHTTGARTPPASRRRGGGAHSIVEQAGGPRPSCSLWRPARLTAGGHLRRIAQTRVALLEVRRAASRVPQLVPIRYGRMLVSPFTFYRGAALIMASGSGGHLRYRG